MLSSIIFLVVFLCSCALYGASTSSHDSRRRNQKGDHEHAPQTFDYAKEQHVLEPLRLGSPGKKHNWISPQKLRRLTKYDDVEYVKLKQDKLDYVKTQSKVEKEVNGKKHKERLPIYTFYSDSHGNQFKWYDDWNLSWYSVGWKPVVLSLKNSKEHEKFEELRSLLEPMKLEEAQNYRFYRWAAMAEVGGWMTDIDVFPLHIQLEDGLQLPNKGRFTLHGLEDVGLYSGSKAEWNKMLQYMIQILKEHSKSEEFTYDVFIAELLKKGGRSIVQEDDVSEGYSHTFVSHVDCSEYSDKVKAVHFLEASIKNAFLGGWLELSLRAQYGKDIELKYRHKDNSIIYQDPETKLYTHRDSILNDIEIMVNEESKGTVSDVLKLRHRTEIALIFMQRVKNQCELV